MIAAQLRKVAYRLVVLSARPTGSWAGLSTLVVVAPHPDDETLGCAAAIEEALRVGKEVYVIVAADGAEAQAGRDLGPAELRRARSQELRSAMQTLGVRPENVRELALPDGTLAAAGAELAKVIYDVVARAEPPCRVLVTCAADPHADHRAAADAARAAAGRVPLTEVWEYPIWLWTDWPVSRRFGVGRELRTWLGIVAFRRARKLPVTRTKAAALAHYRTQLGGEDGDGLPQDLVTRALTRAEVYFPAPGPGRS